MKKLLYITLLSFGLVLMGCPYEGEVELNTYEESFKVDKQLIDEWVSFNEEGGREELVMTKIAKSVLQVSHKRFGKSNKLNSRGTYRAYVTNLTGYDLFTIEERDGKEGGKATFLYAKYGWTGKNEFYLQYIDKAYMETNFIVDSVSTENLRDFITERVNREDMFGEKIEFYRKYSPEYNKVKMYMRKSGF
jgi:hypothetical protein